MNISEFKKEIKKEIMTSSSVGFRFEREGRHHHYRDCIFAYYDGKFIFKRYCYGEAAGVVFDVKIKNIDDSGNIIYVEPLPLGVKTADLPQKITNINNIHSLEIDNNKTYMWTAMGQIKSDKDYGYTRFKFYIKRIFI